MVEGGAGTAHDGHGRQAERLRAPITVHELASICAYFCLQGCEASLEALCARALRAAAGTGKPAKRLHPPPAASNLSLFNTAWMRRRSVPLARELSCMNLSLTDAFDRFRAKPNNRLSSLSAIAADGAMVLTCSSTYFKHPSRGVLRYEDRLSREAPDSRENQLLSQHLALARDGELPIRMVVLAAPTTRSGRSFHVRPDLLGKLIKFDGDHYIIDFVRPDAEEKPKQGRR